MPRRGDSPPRGTKRQIALEISRQLKQAQKLWGPMSEVVRESFRLLIRKHHLSLPNGDLLFLNGRWYITHSGLLSIARTKRCFGMCVVPAKEFSDPAHGRYAFCATVYKSSKCHGFTGYGDADPSNVSELMHGAELRIAETRAVNRALRKAYGIGVCSVEEIGSVAPLATMQEAERKVRKLTPESANGNRNYGHGSNGNSNGIRVRDRLCQVIRQHGLDAELVKAYAIDFCGTKALRDASREQVENFVAHLADWAEKDRSALLCQLNSYSRPQAGAA